MNLTYHDTIRRRVPQLVPIPVGWSPAGYGGCRGDHFVSQKMIEISATVHRQDTPCISESAFENQVELSILEALPGPEMVLVELGAGWGGQSLDIYTAIQNQVVDMAVKSSTCYALEAEPGHYGFLVETFMQNHIPGLPVFGAVSDTLGWAGFLSGNPADSYGQSLRSSGNITVPCYTIETLFQIFSIGRVDLLHMDIQGEEPAALRGATPANLRKIRYLLVCPHHREHVKEVQDLLSGTHRELLCIAPFSGYNQVEGFPLPVYVPQDGIMLWERK